MNLHKIKRAIKSNNFLYILYIFFYSPVRRVKQTKLAKTHYKSFYNKYIFTKKENKKIIYVGIPLHPNLGDQAQYFCILNWLNNNYPEYDILEIPDCLLITNYKNCLKKIAKIITQYDIIVCQSGYRTSDIGNVGGDYAHRIIIKNFSKNKVLVFPQTVNFKHEFEFNKSRDCYQKNKHVLFLARDEQSYKSALAKYKNRVVLFPDIVTTLIGHYNYTGERNGILFCIRNDDEKFYDDNEISILINEYIKDMNILKTDTTIDSSYQEIKDNIKTVIEDKIKEFSKFKIIVTDRYHGTIFGLISQTPTIVIRSSDHKVSTGVKWFKKVSYFRNFIYYANSIDEVKNLINTIIKEHDYSEKLPNYFEKKYYDCLKEIFENEEMLL